MTTEVMPWDALEPAEHKSYSVRMVNGASNLFWGKDENDRNLFLIELSGDNRDKFKKARVKIKGIGSDLRQTEGSPYQTLILILEDRSNRDIFHKLCESLAQRIQSLEDPRDSLYSIMLHLNRWKTFLSASNGRLMTPEQVRGLIAELIFLRQLYLRRMDTESAVHSWQGPHGMPQDFVFDDTAVEIKCISGIDRNSIKISSEDQLESQCERLFLCVYRISTVTKSESSFSLNEMVRMISSEILSSNIRQQFEDKLTENGYIEMEEYDHPRFSVADRTQYLVGEGFPRIVRSEISAGLRKVKYDIELEKLESFQFKEEI